MSARLAPIVVIDNDRHTLTIDGDEFPWALADAPQVFDTLEGGAKGPSIVVLKVFTASVVVTPGAELT